MIKVPCIRVFRRGIMGDWRGPPDNDPQAIADFVKEDALVSTCYYNEKLWLLHSNHTLSIIYYYYSHQYK